MKVTNLAPGPRVLTVTENGKARSVRFARGETRIVEHIDVRAPMTAARIKSGLLKVEGAEKQAEPAQPSPAAQANAAGADLDSLDLEALKARADRLGLTYGARIGADTLRQRIRDAEA